MTKDEVNKKIVELMDGFDEEVTGTTFVPKEQVKSIMLRKMILLAEFLNKKK